MASRTQTNPKTAISAAPTATDSQLPITRPTSATVSPAAKPSGHRLGAGP
jgi:hypothetical protein